MTASQVIAGLLVLLTPIGPWAMVVVWRALRRHPDVHALRQQLVRFALSAAQAILLGVVSLNFLLGSPLPRGGSFVLLLAVLLLTSGPPAVFLVDYYRPERADA